MLEHRRGRVYLSSACKARIDRRFQSFWRRNADEYGIVGLGNRVGGNRLAVDRRLRNGDCRLRVGDDMFKKMRFSQPPLFEPSGGDIKPDVRAGTWRL